MIQERLMRLPEVKNKVALGRSTIWLWMKQGRFPQGIKLSENVRAWRESEINQFITGEWCA